PRSGLILCKEEHAKAIDRAIFPGTQGGPLMHVVAAKAICFGECLRPEFKKYAQQVLDNAKALGEVLVAGGVTLVSGGTDNHLLLADVTALGSTGRTAETVLERCGITVNKNMIPFDQRKPMDPSGIRIGTPALTTRGMGTDEMRVIGQWIVDVLKSPEDEALVAKIRAGVSEMCKQFPVPADR
ncbi:MAG: serine hydroxymethyltransferase, partial [Pirellulaceae bacterium]|nr:serine hydroxymethyltransferase [Pirellulaceae bacterium]